MCAVTSTTQCRRVKRVSMPCARTLIVQKTTHYATVDVVQMASAGTTRACARMDTRVMRRIVVWVQCVGGVHSACMCADVDECETGVATCNQLSQWCVNTEGSYTCCDVNSLNDTQLTSICHGLAIERPGALVYPAVCVPLHVSLMLLLDA
jgi:hypothetical protein